jgi:hypothetical protein
LRGSSSSSSRGGSSATLLRSAGCTLGAEHLHHKLWRRQHEIRAASLNAAIIVRHATVASLHMLLLVWVQLLLWRARHLELPLLPPLVLPLWLLTAAATARAYAVACSSPSRWAACFGAAGRLLLLLLPRITPAVHSLAWAQEATKTAALWRCCYCCW